MKGIIYTLFIKKITIAKWQLNLFGIICISIGIITGSWMTLKGISNILAATTPWTQTDWSGGSGQTSWSDSTKFSSSSNISTSSGQFTLSTTSGWSDTAYKYRKPITLTNTGSELTNFQIQATVDTSALITAGKMQLDCDDIHFTNSSGTTLSYWIESGCSTTTTKIWTKVSSIPNGSSQIYMYYGNSSATAESNGSNTFDFFDDFSGDLSKWTLTGSTAISSGEVGMSGASYNANGMTSTSSINRPAVIEWKSRTTTSSTIETWEGYSTQPLNYGSGLSFSRGWNGDLYRYLDGVSVSSGTWTTDQTQQKIILKPTQGYTIFWNGTQKEDDSTWSTDGNKIAFQARSSAYLYVDDVLVRQYAASEPSVGSPGTEEERYSSPGTLTSSIFDTEQSSDWGTLTYTTDGVATTTVKARTSNSSSMTGATDFASCDAITSGSDISTNNCVTDKHRYIQYQVTLTSSAADKPTFQDISIPFTASDITSPTTNASDITMTRSNGGTSVSSNGWTNNLSPYFSWTAGADNAGGRGLKGYCLYLGADSNGDPATSKGLLGTSPVSTSGSTCQFITSGTSIDFATASYQGSTWLSTSSDPYYLNIKAIDNADNIFSGASTQFQFRFDNTAPTNTSYISCASGNFANVVDMSFSWPTSGSSASSDSNAGILGWQYQINSSSGTWLGTTTESSLGIDNYIPASETSRTLTQAQDGSAITTGTNIVYFRSADAAGNISSAATIKTCALSYGGAAPSFVATDSVTVTPSTSTSNSFALSWPAASPSGQRTITHYYYMINTTPPSTYATITGNTSTYIDTGTTRTVSATALSNVNKGSNTVYVVAVDDQNNYSSSNYISGTFTLNSTTPDNVGNLVSSDSSIKSQSQWNVTLTWTAPSYQGAGNLTYIVKRSTDNITFTQVGTTTGTSYVDNTPSSTIYYYKVYTKDGANAQSSGTNSVSITPTGKWTSAPSLDSGPTVGSITTKKATITWSTSRTADSKIQYGTTSGTYGTVEPSNSSQVTSHSIQLTGLNPGTTYYYKAKWTDEDGNTSTSSEKSFTTSSAPTVKDPKPKSIGLTSAIIQYTVKDTTKVKIYYGKTSSFGGSVEVSTSTSETSYTTSIDGLNDGTKYYYKINTQDSEGTEYDGSILTFETLPRPKITNVRIQQVANTAQSTILVTWTSNTHISSIVSYYPEGKSNEINDEVDVELTKGQHRIIIRGLIPQTSYILIVKGRDKIGNEAQSDTQKITTATDTRPPQISELNVEGSNVPPVSGTAQEQTAQLIVSWNTDEPATSQVEFGEGTGTSYSSKSQEDSNLTVNHLVIISNLSPSKVYHMRAISKDKAGNKTSSVDTVTITPKTTENALNLVITNLQEVFGFLGGIRKINYE